jgi:hypothetical protein
VSTKKRISAPVVQEIVSRVPVDDSPWTIRLRRFQGQRGPDFEDALSLRRLDARLTSFDDSCAPVGMNAIAGFTARLPFAAATSQPKPGRIAFRLNRQLAAAVFENPCAMRLAGIPASFARV